MAILRCVLTTVAVALFATWCGGLTVFEWMQRDNFDEIMDRFSEVTAENCRSKPREELEFPEDTVAQKPVYNMLLTSVIYSNRSQLLHLHNMALNRAFFYSFIFQRLNHSGDFVYQPGLMYLYMSSTADITGSEGFINGSAIVFDNNCYYPNWYLKNVVDFNRTLPRFGPRAWREDDYAETTNWLREPTNRTVDIHDYGAGRSADYTSQAYKYAPWYSLWMPDTEGTQDSLTKYTYTVGVKFSNQTGKFVRDEFENIGFFGPPQPAQTDTELTLPVKWTKPYFDCGRSNKWIVTASAPVVEYMPRYSPFIHLRRPRSVAVSTMDIEFERIDINPCPISEGNQKNYFAGTARCKPTTMCEVLHGYGFQRGGYQCVCKPGYYYPWWHDGPFLGMEIEQATDSEYQASFDCLSVEQRLVIPNEMPTYVERRKRRSVDPYTNKDKFLGSVLTEKESPRIRLRAKRSVMPKVKPLKMTHKLVAKRAVDSTTMKNRLKRRTFYPRFQGEMKHMRHKRDLFDQGMYDRMQRILQRKENTNKGNCRQKPDFELFLPGDAGYNMEKAFEAEGRTALRLAHFLCDFLQNVDEYEEFGSMKGDKRLNETHIFGEVLANVMSNYKIVGSGVFFDRYKFRMSPPENNTDPRYVKGITREFFGPYAWRITTTGDGLDTFKSMDFAGMKNYYTDESWYRNMKARWQTNFMALKQYTAKPMIRSDPNGTSLVRWEHYPLRYYAPKYEHGEWLRPEFKCRNRKYDTYVAENEWIDDWVVTYVVPFFGTNDLKTRLEFHGVITVDVKLDYLEINQCPGDFSVANAFKNTARCHYKSQYCVPLPIQIPTNRFQTGGYKCECRQGYEYPFNDLGFFFDGQMMEIEYAKMMAGNPNRYETLRCRIAGAASLTGSWVLTVLTSLLLYMWNKH